MTTWLVTRHAGAVEWAREIGVELSSEKPCTHLDVESVQAGDIVVGTLPVHLVAEINRRGARYLHLSMEIPADARGRELSAEELKCFGARLEEYHVDRRATYPGNAVTEDGGEVIICLASGQPLANLLPLFMRRPRAIHVVETADPASRKTSERLQEIAARVHLPCGVTKDAPSAPVDEVKALGARLLRQLKQEHPGARLVVNATGGTKVMALGLVSQAGPLAEVIYCDTEHERIEVISPTGRKASPMPPDLVDLNLLLMSQGIERISADSDSDDWMGRARSRAALSELLAALKNESLRRALNGLASNVGPLQLSQELGNVSERDLWVVDRIADFGLWKRTGDHTVVFRDEEAAGYLKGRWLEELAALKIERLCREAGIPKAHWAVGLKVRLRQSSLAPGLAFNELDLAMVWRNRLLVAECKTGANASAAKERMNIVHKLKAIREYLGGPFSSTWLISTHEIRPNSQAADRCRQFGIEIVHPTRLLELDNFIAGWMQLESFGGASTDWSSPRAR